MEATLQIKTLEAQLAAVDIIEVCAWCQRIKIEGHLFRKTRWVRKDSLTLSSAEYLYSHGICPDCKQRLAEAD